MKWRFRKGDFFTLFMLGVFAFALLESRKWPFRASILVLVLGSCGLLLVLAQLVLDWRNRTGTVSKEKKPEFELADFDTADPKATRRGNWEAWGWIFGLLVGIRFLGFQLILPLFVLAYAKVYGARWWISIVLAGFIGLFLYGVFDQILHVYWPEPILLKWIGRLF
ncbi:MAG: tripartite tricarboxylate transporter TctB family protein [Desulfobacterales bacterium]|nr:tripartite tricarboxylate transporter TctB family protein [Desulfobacterales bacterium]